MDPERALQKAVLARLRGDAGVRAALGTPARVYDEPPREAVWPYCVFGRHTTAPLTGEGWAVEHRLTLSVVSRYGGAEEAKAAVGAVRAALAEPVALEAGTLVDLRVTYADVFRASDLRTTVGVVRVRAVTE